jgi:hypothetical protein
MKLLVAKTQLRFFPRNIGLWKKSFIWNGISEPSKVFDSEESLKKFCGEHGVKLDDPDYPFMLQPSSHYIFGEQLAVMQQTCIGYVRYE